MPDQCFQSIFHFFSVNILENNNTKSVMIFGLFAPKFKTISFWFQLVQLLFIFGNSFGRYQFNFFTTLIVAGSFTFRLFIILWQVSTQFDSSKSDDLVRLLSRSS